MIMIISLIGRKKCIWCGHKFDKEIILKTPYTDKCTNSFLWFTGEFLFHSQSTHGYSSEIIDTFLEANKKTI